MKLTGILFFILITSSFSSFAQDAKGIKWISITEAENLVKTEPRKIIVDIYTDWCGWCKRLDATTYKDPQVVDYINKNFYAVKYNAESKDQISFKGKTYSYDQARRVNGLSSILMGNSTGYPTTTFLDEKLEVVSNVPGYQNAEMMNKILRFFGDNAYLKMDWNAYIASKPGSNPEN
jgi:thioredoxin-related protein